MSLKVYNRKRKFSKTPEPPGKVKKGGKGPLKFVVQLHSATRLHYDFRLEFGGSFKSWAVPKGPSINPMDQRLAVFVEDHPLEYGSFEGIIPKGNYGAGTVMVWDTGTYVERSSQDRKDSEAAMKKGFERGHITFVLEGEKLRGEFALIKLKKSEDKAWLLVKKRDANSAYKDITKQNLSVKTGRTLEKIAAQADEAGDIWLSKRKVSAAVVKSKAPIVRSPQPPSKKEAPIPRRVKPMIPISSFEMPKEGGLIFEPHLDGLRAIAELDGRTVHLHSRSLLPFDKKFPEIVKELKELKSKMVLDGEIVTTKKQATYHVYDILYFDGKDLRELPLGERKKILKNAFTNSKLIQQHESFTSLSEVPRKSTEIIAKDAKSSYQSGTSKAWVRLSQSTKTSHKTSALNPSSEPRLTNLDKIFWPKEGITKGDLINYYKTMAPYILPHLKDRPQSLNRHPNGITSGGFYQKDMTGHIPKWLKTQRIYSESRDKSIDYVVCQDERSLLYIANLGCIEMNPWFSTINALDNPDYLVIDLDPDGNDFSQVIKIAHDVHKILDEIGAPNFCKTSGATGIHIGVPTKARYDFDVVRQFAEDVCRVIAKKHPATTSIERNPDRRRKKIYLDFMQNRRGQTLAAPYSVRPRAGAPVSTPLKWKELTPDLRPEQFHMKNTPQRVEKVGDLWKPLLELSTDLEKCARLLRRKYD
jgi:bifunctional non-homologous end joining protein LigD